MHEQILLFFWVGISKAWTCFHHLPLSGSTRSSTHHGNETKAKDATRSRKRSELSLQGETALCIKVHACVDVWSLCFYFSLFFFIATTRVLATQKEWRFELTSPCVFVQSQRSLSSFIYQCLVSSVSAGGGNRAVFPSDEFYLSIYFLLFVQRKNINPLVAECKGHKKVQFISSLSKGIGSTNSSVDRFSSIH